MAAMMQGMMAMMKLWNVFTGGSDFNLGGSFSPSSAFQGPPWSDPWTGAAAVSPWSNPWAGALGGGMPWAGPMGGMPFGPGAGGRPAARPPGPLEGRWVGEAGEAVEFRGERFRLGAQDRGQVTGTFLIHGDRLVLYVPEGDTTRLYRFERRGEYLAPASRTRPAVCGGPTKRAFPCGKALESQAGSITDGRS
jgi:hypothetical protein